VYRRREIQIGLGVFNTVRASIGEDVRFKTEWSRQTRCAVIHFSRPPLVKLQKQTHHALHPSRWTTTRLRRVVKSNQAAIVIGSAKGVKKERKHM
jgi:hypothetical protein